MKFLNKIDDASQLTTDSSNRFVSDAEKLKLSQIEAQATKNDTDANLKNRTNHTGTQLANTISDFANTVRSTVLTGLSTTTNAVIAATDTVLIALGKLQKQISDTLSTLTAHTGNKTNPHSVTKAQVGLGSVDNTSDANKPISSATQTALDGKVDSSRVLTNVPLNAKFTDTNTTYSVISEAEINTGTATTSRVVTAQRLKYITDKIQTLLNGKVDNNQVLTNVPLNAKFTDTNTITTINGKTGAISKADIVALGIPASDTNTTYTAGTGLTLTGTVFTPKFGTTAGTITQGNDSRLSNARTPLAHTHDYLPLGGGALTGDMSIFAGNTDKFIKFDYNGTNAYAWRIGYLGTGSGDANYLTFQSGKATGTAYYDALKFGLDSLVGDFAVTPTVGGTRVSLDGHTHAYEPAFTKNTGFNKAFGTTAGTVAQGNDSRFTNARTPLAHTHTRANITDLGNVAGVNTNASTTQYLRGDGTWATPPNTNTTYSAMSVAEGTAGTATSSRTVRADYLKQIINSYIPTSLPANGGNADTVGGFTVGTNVPAGAKFTDTNTTYGVATTSANGLMSSTDKTKLNGIATGATANTGTVKSVSAGNGLNFTTITGTGAVTLGTPSTITNATTNSVTSTSHTHALTLTKADITALGIPASDTNTTYTEITTAEITAGTATTLRTMTGRRAKDIIDTAAKIYVGTTPPTNQYPWVDTSI